MNVCMFDRIMCCTHRQVRLITVKMNAVIQTVKFTVNGPTSMSLPPPPLNIRSFVWILCQTNWNKLTFLWLSDIVSCPTTVFLIVNSIGWMKIVCSSTQFPKRLLSSMAKEGKFDVFSDFRLNCFQLKILWINWKI